MLTRRTVLMSSIALTAALSGWRANEALAQVDQLQLFVPAAPGGGSDQTSRTVEQVLQGREAGRQRSRSPMSRGRRHRRPAAIRQPMVGSPMRYGGRHDAGRLHHLQQVPGQAHADSADRAPDRRVPRALVVPASSPFKTASDFAAALKADPSKVAVAGGSAAGDRPHPARHDRKALGVSGDPRASRRSPAAAVVHAAIFRSHAAGGTSDYSQFSEQIKPGSSAASPDLVVEAPARNRHTDAEGAGSSTRCWRLRAACSLAGIAGERARRVSP